MTALICGLSICDESTGGRSGIEQCWAATKMRASSCKPMRMRGDDAAAGAEARSEKIDMTGRIGVVVATDGRRYF